MILDIANFLEKLRFLFQNIAIYAQFSSPLLNPQIFIQGIDVVETLQERKLNAYDDFGEPT